MRATLVTLGGGRHRLYINTAMRKQAGADVGDEIRLILETDPEPRDLPVPQQLRQTLEANPEARAIFERLPPSHRNEYLAYLNSLKRPESLERNVQKVIGHLLKQRGALKGRRTSGDE